MKPRVVISAYGADYPARAAPAAQTLAPASQTLAPDSQTLAPAAQTLAPAAQTLASAAQTLAPDSQTLAPASQTLAPAAQTLALDAQIARALAPLCARITDKSRVGVAFTSSKGDLNRLEGGFFGWQPDAPALRWALELGAQGRIAAPNAACASGAHALALGAQWIEDGHADLVLAGAIEPPQHPMVTAAYRNMGALSRGGLMRPFDARRDGFVPGAGGAFFLLENEAHARARGADVHGYLSGWSWSCDAHHITQMAPGGAAIERAIAQALARAGKPKVDYVNAHGTATRNDLIEARALYRAFGRTVAVSSTKPLTGHLLGAAGAVEAALCLDALRKGCAPPTLNLENVDAQIELDLVMGKDRPMKIETALSLNYGFGGHIGVLVFELK